MDLLWTTLSEFPGEGRVASGNGASHVPGATWKQIPFPGELGIIFSTLSCKLPSTVKGPRLYSARRLTGYAAQFHACWPKI